MNETNLKKKNGKNGKKNNMNSQEAKKVSSEYQEQKITMVALDSIVVNPDNPRKTFDETALNELADSIRKVGLIQPITLQQHKDKYMIIAGERRFRAAQIVGLTTLQAIIMKDIAKETAEDITMIENIQRENLSPIEEAKAYERQIIHKNYSIHKIADHFNKNKQYIYQRLSLLKMIPEIQELCQKGVVSLTTGAIIGRYGPDIQLDVYETHLNGKAQDSWISYNSRIFEKMMAAKYNTLLRRYDFDKKDCEICQHNSCVAQLFQDENTAYCLNYECLANKNVIDSTLKILEFVRDNPGIEVCANPKQSNYPEIIKASIESGIPVKYTESFAIPQHPEQPMREEFSMDDDFNFALENYNEQLSDYETQFKEIEKNIENGEFKKVCDITTGKPLFSFIQAEDLKQSEKLDEDLKAEEDAQEENNTDSTGDNTENNENTKSKKDPKKEAVNLLEQIRDKDKKNNIRAISNVVADGKALLQKNDIPAVTITDHEKNILYFTMFSSLDKKHYAYFNLDQHHFITDDEKFKLMNSLSKKQKNILMRDYIISQMNNISGAGKKAMLFIEFMRTHFPKEMAANEKKHFDEYRKQKQKLDEQIKNLKLEELANENSEQNENSIESKEVSNIANKIPTDNGDQEITDKMIIVNPVTAISPSESPFF